MPSSSSRTPGREGRPAARAALREAIDRGNTAAGELAARHGREWIDRGRTRRRFLSKFLGALSPRRAAPLYEGSRKHT
jgi:hypothetical protein